MSRPDRPDNADRPDIPVDPDVDQPDRSRPLHLRWQYIGLVFLGGAVGTGIREALALTWPMRAGSIPVTILLINVVGALVLGALLETLSRRGSDAGRRRTLRLLLGTGVLGGFTTYSSFATDTAGLLTTDPTLAFVYAALTLVVGLAASITGIALSAALHGRTPR